MALDSIPNSSPGEYCGVSRCHQGGRGRVVELGDRHPCQASVCSHGGFAEDPGESMPPSTEPEGVGSQSSGSWGRSIEEEEITVGPDAATAR